MFAAPRIAILHLVATGCALYYAWLISQSGYVKTGLQFVGPFLVIMAVHFVWLTLSRSLSNGFSQVLYRRSAQSAISMAVVILLVSIVAPQPASANANDVLSTVFVVVFCVAIIAIVAAVVGLVVVLISRVLRRIRGRSDLYDDNGPDSRRFDFGSVAVTTVFLAAFALEGLPAAYSFAPGHRSVSSHFVDAPPARVWQTMQTATSPAFPLPDILSVFPQPVDVVTDEGTALGAMRKVKFQGREGKGYLTLQVIERSETQAIFKVLSDTSPYANWVAHKHLTYTVTPEGAGTRLEVALDYDRLLAPAWFFSPATKSAAYLAMDVLARDVKARSEG